MKQVSASSTQIKFKATSGCAGDENVDSLAEANFTVKDGTGQVQTIGFVAADSNNEYTITGTGFASGFTVEIDGVVAQSDIFYEGTGPLTIAVS